MVRLQPSDDLTGEGTSSSDTSIGSKRSRPVSSLDYKSTSGGSRGETTKLVVDDPNWDDPTKSASSNAQSSAKKPNMAFPLMGMNPTRARGSSGFLPPPKPTMKDIESMTQEEIMEMIMNDPELSAKFAAQQKASQKEKFSSESHQRGSTRRSTNSNKKATPLKSSKDRIELLKEQGIPYEQWTILFVLLVFSLYQLYKWMQPPPSKSQRVKSSSAKRVTNVDDDIVAELEDAVAKTANAGANKKSSNRKKKAAPVAKAATTPKKAATPSEAAAVKAPRAPPADVPVIIDEVPLDDDSWMPVVKNKPHAKEAAVAVTADDAITVHTANTSKTKKQKKPSPAIPSVVVEKVNHKPIAEATIAETTEPVAVVESSTEAKEVIKVNGTADAVAKDDFEEVNGAEEEDTTAPATTDAKKKKLKKKKPKNGTAAAPVVPASDAVVDADAILAQQLQYEEDQLAAAASSEAATEETTKVNGTKSDEEEENNWAEVTKKKKSAPMAPETTSTDLETEDA